MFSNDLQNQKVVFLKKKSIKLIILNFYTRNSLIFI